MTRGDANPAGVTTHHLPRFVFDQICDGSVSREGITVLRNGQYSLRKLRLRTFAEEAAATVDQQGPFAEVESAWDLLAEAERTSPEVVEDVLMYPMVGVWLSRALRQVLGMALDTTPLWSEVGVFHLVAAAAAVRSGLLFEIVVPVVHGAVMLPSVGAFRIATSFPVGHAILRNTRHGLTLTVLGRTTSPPLEPVKRHRAAARGRIVELVFDDLDPYREFTAPLPAGPLSDQESAEWRKLMDEAWDLLTACHPECADELSACLAAVVPLSVEQQVFAASSTAAFGCIAMSPKRSALEFAEALVHEIQHSKVNALLDLVVLCEDDDVCRFYAPWLDHPRPVTGLLHGLYAFCSVVEFWYLQRDLVPASLVRRAHFNFAYRRHQVAQVVRTLSGAPELTDLGRTFVAAVSVRLAACPLLGVPGEVTEAIEWIIAAHRGVWRLRHVRPDEDVVAALTDAWIEKRGPSRLCRADLVATSPETGRTTLATLIKARVVDPERFAALGVVDDAEAAFLSGDMDRAAECFTTRLDVAPEDVTAWSGLALALDSTALRRLPEVVRAVRRSVAASTGRAPDPGQLAAWLDQAAG
ncbi:HEXXH motif domain-containing protein [Lentzea tibetensis]|uniref:HEXXH motif domain-containing protein n=1 Tax=Lentzea tibetensis TaxID=2591470 RepID=UPI001647B671|nr:HEXXH motif domain-containing protein [Lentzea tibetensis]